MFVCLYVLFLMSIVFKDLDQSELVKDLVTYLGPMQAKDVQVAPLA